MNRSILLLYLGLALLANGGCRAGRGPQANGGPQPVQPAPAEVADTAVHFVVRLALHAGSPDEAGWWLELRTVEHFSCANYIIRNEFTQGNGRMVLKLNQIVRPEICLTALGPATCAVKLGNPVPSGRYDFTVFLPGGEPVRGRLASDGSRVQLQMGAHPMLTQEE